MTDNPEQPASEPAGGTADVPDGAVADLIRLRTRIFLLSPLRKRLARCLARMLGKTAGQNVLSCTADELVAAVVAQNADPAGEAAWTAAAESPARGALLAGLGFRQVSAVSADGGLGVGEATQDAAVLSCVLEYAVRPEDLMAQVHRALRPKTRLILHVRRRRRSVIGLFRRWAGLADPARPPVRNGFTPAELFDAIKDGFDVQETEAYGKFFTEFTELLAELFAGLVPDTCEEASLRPGSLKRALWAYRLFTPFFWISAALDSVCFFLPCHHLVVRAKRRMLWVPRVTPRLRDGRSIAEAALGSKIGTAVES
jgi:SAM-dependent methyltransferase